jgi:transcriptional regulator with XRE-family HTH domain
MGTRQDTISQLETGKREAQPRTIRRLLEALGVEPRTLMKED